MPGMLWHRVRPWAAPLLLAAPVFAQLDAEACFRLYYGAGPTRDLARARACFRKGSASARVQRVPLPPGPPLPGGDVRGRQGGAASPGKARALLSECFDDADIAEIRQRMAAARVRRRATRAKRISADLCGDHPRRNVVQPAGLHANRHGAGEMEKSVLARLDPPGANYTANGRWPATSSPRRMRRQSSESISPGTLAPAAANDRVNEVHAQQCGFAGTVRYGFIPEQRRALAEAVRALRERYRQQVERDQRARVRETAERAQEAWMAYRDATPAFLLRGAQVGRLRRRGDGPVHHPDRAAD